MTPMQSVNTANAQEQTRFVLLFLAPVAASGDNVYVTWCGITRLATGKYILKQVETIKRHLLISVCYMVLVIVRISVIKNPTNSPFTATLFNPNLVS
jgi:hypothetical protein